MEVMNEPIIRTKTSPIQKYWIFNVFLFLLEFALFSKFFFLPYKVKTKESDN